MVPARGVSCATLNMPTAGHQVGRLSFVSFVPFGSFLCGVLPSCRIRSQKAAISLKREDSHPSKGNTVRCNSDDDDEPLTVPWNIQLANVGEYSIKPASSQEAAAHGIYHCFSYTQLRMATTKRLFS